MPSSARLRRATARQESHRPKKRARWLLLAENDDVPFRGRHFGAAAPGDGDEDETVADGDITRRHRRFEGADNAR